MKAKPTSRQMATSMQFEGNGHRDSIFLASFHTNHGNLCIGLVQVEDCELPKQFIGRPVGDWVLVRQLVEEGLSRTSRSVQSQVIKYTNLLRRRVRLDMCMQNKTGLSTHGGWWGDLCLCGDIQSNPGMVVDGMTMMVVWRRV